MKLGTFSPNARPENVRGCLDAYYRMLDVAKQLRAEMAANGEPLADRITMAGVQADIEDAIVSAKRWLSRRARRGAPVTRAMAHGCAASSPAIGLALRADQGGAVAPHADPLLSCQQWQDLPAVAAADNTQSRVGGGVSHDICV